jgi:LuxR family maltose regulon positive regulatory protein
VALTTAGVGESALEILERPAVSSRVALVESKLVPPRARPGSVERSALIEGIRTSGAQVVSIVAPAGYGKTTLLRQWLDREPARVAWLSLDDLDDDPAVLWTGLSATIARAIGADPDTFGPLGGRGRHALPAAIPGLVAALAVWGKPHVIMLDDIEVIHEPECRSALAWLAGHLPHHVRLAAAGRTPPPFQLARLRSQGALLEIGVAGLALTEQEAAVVLDGVGANLPEIRVAELARRTEGWPTGIHLAGLSVHARPVSDGPPEPLGGDDRLIIDYLRSEVFDRLPPGRMRFLVRTSVLDRLNGPLCDAVLGTTGSSAILEGLERSNLFLVPLDERRSWYRYHHLFRDALRRQLALDEPGAVQGLHERAAEWLEANGHPDAAVEAARAAGDTARLGRLIGRLAVRPGQWGRPASTERWLAWFDDEASLERWVPVAVIGALVHALSGRPADAERWADAAACGSGGGPMPDGSATAEAWLALLRAVMDREGVDAMRADSRTALRRLSRSSPWRAAATMLLGVAELLGDEAELARSTLTDAVELADATGDAVTASLARAEGGILAAERGDWAGAETLAAGAQHAIVEARLEDSATSALTYALAARLAVREGDFEAAHRWLGRAQRFRPQLTHAVPWLAVQVRVELAQTYLAIAETSGARTLLVDMADIIRRRPDLGVLVTAAGRLDRQTEELRGGTPGAWTLTTAELRLLPYLPTHLSFREIAGRLCVSLNTVKTQAISVYGKLGASSRSGAIERAIEVGLLDPSVANLPGASTRLAEITRTG